MIKIRDAKITCTTSEEYNLLCKLCDNDIQRCEIEIKYPNQTNN